MKMMTANEIKASWKDVGSSVPSNQVIQCYTLLSILERLERIDERLK